MKKNILICLISGGAVLLLFLQSCKVNNDNPTIPLPVPTSTPPPTSTYTSTPTTTPVACNTHVVISEASGVSTPIAADYTYANRFTLASPSNFNAVTVAIAASASGAGNNLQIAIYSDSSDYPGSVLFTSGTHQITSTGGVTVTFNPSNFSLPAGNYWLALCSSVAYQPYQNVSNDNLNYIVGGDFPDPFPASAPSPGFPWSYNMATCHP